MFADEPVSVHRCLAAVGCSGDCLSIPEIPHVSGRKYSGHIRLGFLVGNDVAFGVEIYLPFEDRSVWFVAYSYKHPVFLVQLFLYILTNRHLERTGLEVDL